MHIWVTETYIFVIMHGIKLFMYEDLEGGDQYFLRLN